MTSRLLALLFPETLFARLTIANKMLLGYMTLVVLTVVVVAYALLSLQRINNLNRDIVKVDVIVEEAADKMLDALLAQDTYEKRFLILKSRDMQNLFLQRGREFRIWLDTAKKLPDRPALPLSSIDTLYTRYTDLFAQEVKLVRSNDTEEARTISNRDTKTVMNDLTDVLRKLSNEARAAQENKMGLISTVSGNAFYTTALLCLISVVIGALAVLVVTNHISSSLHKLSEATEHIASGDFDYDPKIRTEDEVGSLAEAFLTMGKRLRKLEEMYLDASPLTRLPGGIAIENVLKKRLESGQPIAFCVLDLDNFKAFNDRYGYANGSEVIKESARIIEAAVKAKGTPEDFVGHVGGDDFVVITIPDLMREVSTEIINQFDARIPSFYAPEDRNRGYIMGKTRQGVEMQFPIMTISIAIVTNGLRKLTNPLEASEIAAELKDYAKTIPKSIFVVDKRRSS